MCRNEINTYELASFALNPKNGVHFDISKIKDLIENNVVIQKSINNFSYITTINVCLQYVKE